MINDDKAILHRLGDQLMAAGASPSAEFGGEQDTAMPAALRNWLVRLRLLEGVPFANLVADSELLPPESIRWFFLDRRWTDALVQGALSVGTVNSDDRIQLEAQYPAARAELDTEERNQRRHADAPRLQGGPGPISGFLLRSRAVSGWPGMHVRAFNVDPAEGDDARYPEDDERRIRLLRLERLAPAVLLCLFDGVPKVVHIEEPRQGVQFGFMHQDKGGQRSAKLRPRNKQTFNYLDGSDDDIAGNDNPGAKDIDVPFRIGSSGVVDIRRLSEALAEYPETGTARSPGDDVNDLDSAEYALQLVRFPWRQVFGDVKTPDIPVLFRPTLGYSQAIDDTFEL